jgi:hypothetical protein
MDSTVKSRPNYYEMLGLTPSAAADAIAQAFARTTSVFRPHVFGGITELCVAYETLRDPARRRAYDASLGLAPKSKIPPITLPASAHFAQRPSAAFVAPSEPKGEPMRQEPVVKRPAVAPPPQPKVEPKPPEPVIRRPVQLDSPMPRQPAFSEVNVGVRPIEWKRTGTIVGGLAAAAVFVGVFTGWWSARSAAVPEQPQRVARAARLPEKPLPTLSELWPEPTASAVEARADQPRRAVAIRPRVQRNTHRPQLAASDAESQLIQPPPELADSAAADPLAPEAVPAPAVAATMPLPHKMVARTIDRIGYSCGQVASATPVDGAAGVYRVTCTSGQSFQAKPINGRYRFRRLAKN